MESPIESWIVESSVLGSRELWMVRGYRHPEDYVVVSPYIIGGSKVKQYDWSGVPEWIIKYVPCIGRRAPLLPRRSITRIIDPAGVLKARRNDIPQAIVELLDIIAPEWAGITGSWAVFEEKPSSDVDIIVYGNHKAIYRVLLDLKVDGVIESCMVEERYLKVKDRLSWTSYSKLATLKVLDSCYKGVPYTIKILRRLDREPCGDFIVDMGAYRGALRIVKTLESHLTPARYIVDIGGIEALMETWHMRYMELPEGLYIGHLELFDERGATICSPDLVGSLEGPL
jgi:predicted nucleotidyltransferase